MSTPPDPKPSVPDSLTPIERRFQDDQALLRLALETAEMGTWVYDIQSNTSIWNDREYELVGLPVGNGIVSTDIFFTHIHPDDVPNFKKLLAAAIANGTDYTHEYRVRLPAGKVRWLAGKGRAVRDPNTGKVVRMMGVTYDISERKAAEEESRKVQNELLRSKISLENAQALARMGSWEMNLKTMQGTWSPEMFHLFGLDPAKGTPSLEEFLALIHPEDRHVITDAHELVMTSKPIQSSIFRTNPSRGPVRYFAGWVQLLRDANGEPATVIGTDLDVTESKLLEQQLLQSQKVESIGRLAGGIAHDFNNLLTSIIGFSEMARAESKGMEPFNSYVERIDQAAHRGAALTQQLLGFARKQMMQPSIFNLNQMLQRMQEFIQRTIGENIELLSFPAKDLPQVKMDVAQMDQVLMNLVINARDAMPDGGKLTLETALEKLDEEYARTRPEVLPGQYVRLSVTDTGCGMTSEVQAKLFEPFFTTKPMGKGTGLGLATSYGIVKQNLGHIAVYSEPKRGTTVKVYLPAVNLAPDPQAAKKPFIESGTGNETLLVVEDDEMIRTMIKVCLTHSGYQVISFANGLEALQYAERNPQPIHLLLTDVVMPKISGPELAKRITKLRPGIKILYSSGYTENAIVHQNVLDQGIWFIQKPYTPVDLAKKIREVLDTTNV